MVERIRAMKILYVHVAIEVQDGARTDEGGPTYYMFHQLQPCLIMCWCIYYVKQYGKGRGNLPENQD